MNNSVSAEMPNPIKLKKSVELMIREQKRAKFTHSRMAEELGISRTLWYLIQKGIRQPFHRFYTGILIRFPQYEKIVTSEMKKTAK